MEQGSPETRGIVIRFDGSKRKTSPAERHDASLGSVTCLPRSGLIARSAQEDLDAEREAERNALADRVERAMREWEGCSGEGAKPLPPRGRDEVLRALPSIVNEIRNDFFLDRPVEDQRARRALHALYGDAALRHLALMTPQGILTLPGCGRAVLSRVIRELSRASAMTIPELVTGTGKAALELVAPSPLSEDLYGLLPPSSLCHPPSHASRPRLI